jgi:hypothetical protein
VTRTLHGKRLLAVPLLAIAAVLGSVLPANAANAPILYADSGDTVHHCTTVGPPDMGVPYVAVVCVDINTGANSSGYWATGEVEAYCEEGTASYILPCSSIEITGEFANADNDIQKYTWGCSDGGCPNSRKIIDIATFNYTGGTDCDTSSGHNVWTVVEGSVTTIVMPGGATATLGPGGGANDGDNYSSGHYWVCP